MRTTLIHGGLVAAVALVLAGCGSAATSTATGTAVPAAEPAADVVTVTMTDFALALHPTTVGPGPHTFHAVNAGKVAHSLELNGPGVSGQRISGVVQPGASGDLTVTLQNGAYDLYCPVGNHRAMGMEVTFSVGGGTVPSATPGSSGGSSY
jgi:plastocyanin